MIKKIYSLSQVRKTLPHRKKTDNKTHGGKCLVIAGSQGLWGAAVLCAQAASRMGAGYVYLYDPHQQFPAVQHPDFLTLKTLNKNIDFTSIAVGPGFKDSRQLKSVLKKLISLNFPSVVLDAEALNFLSRQQSIKKLPPQWIITPHEGELARLIGVSSTKIRAERIKYIQIAQKKWGCIVLLKGHQTLIADSHQVIEIPAGNPALAKAGTGDVLTGMISGLLSQKNSLPLQVAANAAYIHGYMADRWIKSKKSALSLMPSDLIALIPETLKYISGV